jgi:hypothetical protein
MVSVTPPFNCRFLDDAHCTLPGPDRIAACYHNVRRHRNIVFVNRSRCISQLSIQSVNAVSSRMGYLGHGLSNSVYKLARPQTFVDVSLCSPYVHYVAVRVVWS